MSRRQAIDIALDALGNSGIGSFLSAGPLPDGIKALLRIVAEGEWRDAATEHAYRKHGAETVREASAALLTEVLFAKQTDPYRVLGLPPGASLGEVREHKRLLLKWLHPDRNPDQKERAYLTRVIEATEAIESGRGNMSSATPRQQTGTHGASYSVPPPAKGPDRRQGKSRKTGEVWTSLVRALRQSASRSIGGILRLVKAATLTLALLLFSLLAWRYVMDESIGDSITRYSKLAVGLVAWP